MRTIDITTTQNVTIEYDLASTGQRILSYFIDLFIIGISVSMLSIFEGLAKVPEVIITGQALLLFSFYALSFEIWWNGKTPGKKAVGLQVVKIDGSKPTIEDLLIRWSFRLVDIYFTLGSVAALAISASNKAQRPGDVVAQTTVIQFKKVIQFDLKKYSVRAEESRELKSLYPEVVNMNDEEMMLVKYVARRVREYPNAAHMESAELLSAILKERLGIQHSQEEPIKFLGTLVKEYVQLTR